MCLCLLSLSSLPKGPDGYHDPKGNPGVEGVDGDGLNGKGPFPSLPGLGPCSPNEKRAHFSLSSWSVQCIHLVFMSLALTLMARHRRLRL